MGFEVVGIKEVLANMDRLIALVNDPATLKEVFLPEAELIRDEAKGIVPVRTGKLRDHIFAVDGTPEAPNVIVGVDGTKVPYAHIVELRQPFLRPAGIRAEGGLPQRVADRLRAKFEGVLD